MGKPNESPDSIPLKQNDLRASGIRFNGRYEDSLRGFAFRTYEVEGLTAPTKIFGVAVFLSNSSVLDPYLQNSSELTIQYDPHPELAQIMEGCSVLSGTDMVTPGGAALRVYDISCKIMYGVYS
jgi:hypothetical protein